jgi:hypothetical protein
MRKKRNKVGRPACNPTANQRRRLMRGIAIGLTLDQLAADIDMPESTMRRVFAADIRTARTRLILDNLDRLHDAADHGNVSAMRALAAMMQSVKEEEDEHDDAWADVIDAPSISSGKADFH